MNYKRKNFPKRRIIPELRGKFFLFLRRSIEEHFSLICTINHTFFCTIFSLYNFGDREYNEHKSMNKGQRPEENNQNKKPM